MLHVRCCCQKTLHWSCKYNLLRRSWFIDYLGGGGFKPFSFSPLLGEVIQFDAHIFQMRWNHQLDQSGEGSDDGYPEANSSPLKIDSWKIKFPFQKPHFEGYYFQGGYFKGDGSTQCHGPFPPFNSVNWPWAWRIIPGLTMVDNSPKSGCGSPSKWPFLVGCKRGWSSPHTSPGMILQVGTLQCPWLHPFKVLPSLLNWNGSVQWRALSVLSAWARARARAVGLWMVTLPMAEVVVGSGGTVRKPTEKGPWLFRVGDEKLPSYLHKPL